jgi:Carboxypeptidase regulatory-like domain
VLVFEVPAQVAYPVPGAPLVRRPLVIKDAEMLPLTGEVVGPDGQSLAGVRIEIAGTTLATYTDRCGQFTFASVPASDRVRLRLPGRGPHVHRRGSPDRGRARGRPLPVRRRYGQLRSRSWHAQLLSFGIYVEEVPSGARARPIGTVGTSTAASSA